MIDRRQFVGAIPILMMFGLPLAGCSQPSTPPEAEDLTTNDVPEQPRSAADYETTLFDTSYVHAIDIELSDEDWADLLAHPTDKTKYHAKATIDGEAIDDVSFSTKGNSSLFFVAEDPEATRFSFRITFDKFVEGQTYHGLDALALNNSFCDSTYEMKDYLSFALFKEHEVPAPLASYAWLRVNGEDHGLYLGVENVRESFLDREFDGTGVIYAPEAKSLSLTLDQIKDIRKNGLPKPKRPHGCNLAYTDDDPESYPDIFENVETYAVDTNSQEVIAALKALSNEENLDAVLDTDEIIRYFAVHNFALNYDSYTGAMLHNLIMHDNKGRLSLIPWDYNLAYATFVPGAGKGVLKDPTDLVNTGIDSPLIGTTEDERPMWKWIVNDDAYREQYHNALDALVADSFESGRFDEEISRVYEMILPYVEKDPTGFFTVGEFAQGYETLRQFANRRAESIRKQLSGNLPTVNADQDDSDKVDASDLKVMDMGAFATGKEL